MHFKKIDLKNYRIHQSAQIPLFPLTLIVGPMGVGKTSITEGARFAINGTIETRDGETKINPDMMALVANNNEPFGVALTTDNGSMIGYKIETGKGNSYSLKPITTKGVDSDRFRGDKDKVEVWTLSQIRGLSSEKLKKWFFSIEKPVMTEEIKHLLHGLRPVEYWDSHDIADCQAELEKEKNELEAKNRELDKIIKQLLEQSGNVPSGNVQQVNSEYEATIKEIGKIESLLQSAANRQARKQELTLKIQMLSKSIETMPDELSISQPVSKPKVKQNIKEKVIATIGDYSNECPNCEMPFTATEFLSNWDPEPTESEQAPTVRTVRNEQKDTLKLELERCGGELSQINSESNVLTVNDTQLAILKQKRDQLKADRDTLNNYQSQQRMIAQNQEALANTTKKLETVKLHLETAKNARDNLINGAVASFCQKGDMALAHTRERIGVRTEGKFALGLQNEITGFRTWESLSGGEFLLFNSALVSILHGSSNAQNKLLLVNDLDRISPVVIQCEYLRQLSELQKAGVVDQVIAEGAFLFDYDTMSEQEKEFYRKYRERIVSYGFVIIELLPEHTIETSPDGKQVSKTLYKQHGG